MGHLAMSPFRHNKLVRTFAYVQSQHTRACVHCKYGCVLNCTVAPTSSPVGVATSSVSSRSIQLTWNPPPDDQINGIIQHYIVKVQVAESQEQTQHQTSSLQFTLTDLQPYCTHTIEVAAFTIALGPFSEPLTVLTPEDGEVDNF